MSILKVQRHVTIYKDRLYYCAMPSAVTLSTGEIITAFRRAPDRRLLGRKSISHCDPNSQLVLVRSNDNGHTWNDEPELIFSHPLGGCQDPCLFRFRNDNIICSSYGWCLTGANFNPDSPEKHLHIGPYYFLGGFLVHSEDRGKNWQMLPLPPALDGNAARDVFANKYSSFNRGSMAVNNSGQLLWSVTSHASITKPKGKIEILSSLDNGNSWQHISTAAEANCSLNESSLYVTPKGTVVCFIRSFGIGDKTVVARSFDGGNAFEPLEITEIIGHPHQAIRLIDDRVLLVYGYRHQPYGIRARILDSECQELNDSEEIILREDGGNADLGYPWATRMPDGKILVTYYFNSDDGTRSIEGTILA